MLVGIVNLIASHLLLMERCAKAALCTLVGSCTEGLRTGKVNECEGSDLERN